MELEDAMDMTPVHKALQNPVILYNIFKFLPEKDWHNARMVCQLWYDESLRDWRKSIAQVFLSRSAKLGDTCGVAEFTYQFKRNTRSKQTSEPVEFFRKPFRRYCIDHRLQDILPSSVYPKGKKPKQYHFPQLDLFWEICGSRMEELELRSSFNSVNGAVKSLELILGKAVPNLKAMKLKFWIDRYRVEARMVQDQEENVIAKAAFGLSSLTISVYDQTHSRFQQSFFRMATARRMLNLVPNITDLRLWNSPAVEIARALPFPTATTGEPVKLKRLEVASGWRNDIQENETVFTSLRMYVEKVQPPLTHLKIFASLDAIRTPPFDFHQFIGLSAGSTLTNLRLTVYRGESNSVTWFTDLTHRSFPHLTHFSLLFEDRLFSPRNEINANGRIPFDFRALAGMPVLKVFRCSSTVSWRAMHGSGSKYRCDGSMRLLSYPGDVHQWNYEVMKEMPQCTINLPSLEEISYFPGYKLDCHLKRLGAWATNLKKLEVAVHESALPSIFEIWPGLQTLALLEDTIPKETLSELKKSLKAEGNLCTVKEVPFDTFMYM